MMLGRAGGQQLRAAHDTEMQALEEPGVGCPGQERREQQQKDQSISALCESLLVLSAAFLASVLFYIHLQLQLRSTDRLQLH